MISAPYLPNHRTSLQKGSAPAYISVSPGLRTAVLRALQSFPYFRQRTGTQVPMCFRSFSEQLCGPKVSQTMDRVFSRVSQRVWDCSSWQEVDPKSEIGTEDLSELLQDSWGALLDAERPLQPGTFALQQQLCLLYLSDSSSAERSTELSSPEELYWLPLKLARDLRRAFVREHCPAQYSAQDAITARTALESELNHRLALGLPLPTAASLCITNVEVAGDASALVARYLDHAPAHLVQIAEELQAIWLTESAEIQQAILDRFVTMFRAHAPTAGDRIPSFLLPLEREALVRQTTCMQEQTKVALARLDLWQAGHTSQVLVEQSLINLEELLTETPRYRAWIPLQEPGRPELFVWDPSLTDAAQQVAVRSYLLRLDEWLPHRCSEVDGELLRLACMRSLPRAGLPATCELSPFGMRLWLMSVGVCGPRGVGDASTPIGAVLQTAQATLCLAEEQRIRDSVLPATRSFWEQKAQQEGWSTLLKAPLGVRLDPTLLLEALTQDPTLVEALPLSLQMDASFLCALATEAPAALLLALRRLPATVPQDRQWFLDTLSLFCTRIPGHSATLLVAGIIGPELREDLDFAAQIVGLSPALFRFAAGPTLRADLQSMRCLLQHSPEILLQDALPDDWWRQDKSCMQQVASQNGLLLEQMDPCCWRWLDVVRAAIRQHPQALDFVKKAEEMVSASPAQYTQLSVRTQQIPSVAAIAVRKGLPLAEVHPALREHARVAAEAVWYDVSQYLEVAVHLQTHPKWVAFLCDHWPSQEQRYQYFAEVVPHALRENSEWMLERMQKDPRLSAHASEEVRQNPEFLKRALADPRLIETVRVRLQVQT